MIRPLTRLLAVLAAALIFAFPALAADKAIIILDASGSMWAQIDGKARIDIARDSLKQVLAGVSADLELGFMAYGHRTKGDCKDIEMLVEPAAGTADQIIGAAQQLNPKGKTPLSAAVQQAADALKYTEDKATVILITDGIETCDADPCALATALAKDGVDFKVNVVGFGLSDADGEKVKCLADNTHGVYIQADDADGLKNAIQEAVSDTPAPPPSEEPVVSSEEPSTDITFAPTAVMVEGGDPLLDGQGNVAWEFYKVNPDGSQGEWVRTEYGNAYQGAIDPGTYLINAKLDYAHVTQTVTIEAGQIAKPIFDLEAGFIDVRPLDADGNVNGGAAVYTEFPDTTSTTSYGEVKTYVPAGTTKLSVTIGTAKIDDEVTVAAGDSVVKDVTVAFGHASITASYSDGQLVGDSGLFVDVLEPQKDIQGNRKEVTYGYGPTVELDLAPGDYVAVAKYDAATVEQPFTIKAGEANAFDIDLNAGVLVLTTDGADYTEIFSAKKDIQGKRVSFGGNYDNPSSRTLAAGDYHVVVTLKDNAGTKEADVSVKAGERNEVTIP